MDFNFLGGCPLPDTLADSHKLLRELWECCRATEAKNKKLQDKLKTNSSNSSTSPSRDSIKQKAEKRQDRDLWKKRTLAYWKNPRQGAQDGHKGSGRLLVPIETVDEIILCHPKDTCSYCSGSFKRGRLRQRKQVFDLPSQGLRVTEYQIYGATCLKCKRTCRGELPAGTPSGILGHSALSKIATLTGRYHLSKREVQTLLFEFFNLKISLGTVSNAEKLVSNAISSSVDAVGESLLEQKHLHVDETGHNHKGGLEWLWIASNQNLSYFKIYQHRNTASAKALIGDTFQGMIISDRYGAYNWLPSSQRQYCWAHLKRDFQKFADSEQVSAKIRAIASCLGVLLKKFFRCWRGYRYGKDDYKGQYQNRMRRAIAEFYHCLREGRQQGNTHFSTFCKKLIKERISLWHFLRIDGVEPTNNHAERGLRSAVIWRNKCYGTQSTRGVRFVERILTVISTCIQQKRDLLNFLTKSLQAYRLNKTGPSLL